MGNDREEDLYAHPGPVQCGPTHHHACACREAMFAEYKKDWEARLAKAERVIDDLFDAIEELEGSPMNRNNKSLAIAAGYALLKDENKRLREALEYIAQLDKYPNYRREWHLMKGVARAALEKGK